MDNNIDTIIGINVVLKGNLKNQGSIQVNGTIEGEVRSDEHINIGETAKVRGPVVAKTVEVSGEVNGLIEASERLEIHPTGKVTGDINAKSLIIQQGATFVGKSIMPAQGKNNGTEEAESTEETEPEEVTKEEEAEKKPETEIKQEIKEDKTEKNEKERDPLGFFRK